jgi:hypothetical protein
MGRPSPHRAPTNQATRIQARRPQGPDGQPPYVLRHRDSQRESTYAPRRWSSAQTWGDMPRTQCRVGGATTMAAPSQTAARKVSSQRPLHPHLNGRLNGHPKRSNDAVWRSTRSASSWTASRSRTRGLGPVGAGQRTPRPASLPHAQRDESSNTLEGRPRSVYRAPEQS